MLRYHTYIITYNRISYVCGKGKGQWRPVSFPPNSTFFLWRPSQSKKQWPTHLRSKMKWTMSDLLYSSFPHTFPVFLTIRPQHWKTLHLQFFSILAFSHSLGRFACLSKYLTDLLSFHYSCQASKQSFSFLYSHSHIFFLIIHTYPQMMTENLNKQKSSKAFCWG